MIWLILLVSVILFFFGHLFKVFRIEQLIETYEKPNDKVLLQALTYGNIINFFIPFRLGHLFRAYYAGKKMKNGTSFSLATVIVDIIIDFFSVLLIYLILYIFNFNVIQSLKFYAICCLIILIVIALSYTFNNVVKKIIYGIASIFNDKIELKMLKFSWFTITSFKDLIKRINIPRMIFYTVITWSFYIASYYTFSISLTKLDYPTSFIDLFNIMFSKYGMSQTMINWSSTLLNEYNWIMIIYILLPIAFVYIFSFFINIKHKPRKYIEILPQVNTQNRLDFLKQYFNSNDSNYFKKYMELNNDVAIIEDHSAGSNATTILCSKDDQIFYRKYAFDKDADKLHDQVVWLKEHEKLLPLTKVSDEKYSDGCCCYDMPYVANAVTCFSFVHTTNFTDAWKMLKNILDDLSEKLHSKNVRKSDITTIDSYIDSKVLKNIDKIEQGEYIKPLLCYKKLIINGVSYNNLSYYKKYLNKEYLEKVFKNDDYSDIHGDFTIENIICYRSKNKNGYYIIDPNTGNLHDSPYLDFAKLLQSIHGGYEFMMNTKKVEYHNNEINFTFTKSDVYNKLYSNYKKYLIKKFGNEGTKSIFYHEVIHWLRLMPYKIRMNGDRSLIFYSGLLMVLADVDKMFGDK